MKYFSTFDAALLLIVFTVWQSGWTAFLLIFVLFDAALSLIVLTVWFSESTVCFVIFFDFEGSLFEFVVLILLDWPVQFSGAFDITLTVVLWSSVFLRLLAVFNSDISLHRFLLDATLSGWTVCLVIFFLFVASMSLIVLTVRFSESTVCLVIFFDFNWPVEVSGTLFLANLSLRRISKFFTTTFVARIFDAIDLFWTAEHTVSTSSSIFAWEFATIPSGANVTFLSLSWDL